MACRSSRARSATAPRRGCACAWQLSRNRQDGRCMAVLPPFQRFLEDHRDDVWRFLVAAVGRTDADDCFQETFMAAMRAYPRLRAGGPDHNLRAWVLTIAHRKAL